jgi:transposase, IS5 family
MQRLGSLSAPSMGDALCEIESMRRLIADNGLRMLILDKVNQHLSRKGLLLKTGTIIDATI